MNRNSKIDLLNPVKPVIFVLGLGEKMHKFELQLILREKYIKEGYKVSQIGSRNNSCELLGFHSFPLELHKNNLTESEKVIYFNRYIKHIENEEKPDIFIIGIPGGIMPYSNQFTNRFGFMSYIVSNAVEPDAGILSINYGEWTKKLLEKLTKTTEYKLGFPIDCFNISNTQIDWTASIEKGHLMYNILEKEFIEIKKKELLNSKLPVYYILDNNDVNNMTELIIDKLAEYGESQVM